jgi:hypothetical protein
MEPRSPEEWWPLFQQAMRAGDLAALRLYEPEAAFTNASGQVRIGHAQLRVELGSLADARASRRTPRHYDRGPGTRQRQPVGCRLV